jgi:hypothetical protein
MKKTLYILASIVLGSSFLQASSLTLEDFSYALQDPNGSSLTGNGSITALWGTYSAGAFTPLITSTPNSATNSGYAAISGDDLLVNLSQSNNNNVIAGTALSISFYNLPEGSTYSATANQIVLTDPTWVAPTFVFGTSATAVNFTSSTTTQALTGFLNAGTFTFSSGGSDILRLATIPEPSTYALMALGGLVLFFIARRRKAQV